MSERVDVVRHEDGSRTISVHCSDGSICRSHFPVVTEAVIAGVWEAVAEEAREVHGRPDATAEGCRQLAHKSWSRKKGRRE